MEITSQQAAVMPPARAETAKSQVVLKNGTTLSHNLYGVVTTAPYIWHVISF